MSAIKAYIAPHSLQEAADVLRAGNVTVLAGGTDLMPQSRSDRTQLRPVLMNIRRIQELHGIAEMQRVLRIGALTTITELRDCARVHESFSALWQGCDHFASDQIRNAGTIGGNICNASPAGDTIVPLLVLDARLVLASKPNGVLATRTIPLAEFITGPGRTTLAPHELLAWVDIPWPPTNFVSTFFKFGTRPALDVSVVSFGFAATRNGSMLHDVHIAFGAVAPRPIRAAQTEAVLEGNRLDDSAIAAAATAADNEIHPISDVRASAWYRRELIRNMFKRMLTNVRDR